MYQGFKQALLEFRFKPIFNTAVAASKNPSHFKCGQKGPEKNDHAYFAKFKSKSMIHSVGEKLKNNDENKCSGL